MASINKAILIGNLGSDPELRYTNSGQAVANFNIATTESWGNKQTGTREEKTEWHRIVAWGKLAELCNEYLVKGRSVYIEGRIQTRQWDDRDGNKRYTTEIVAKEIQFLGGRGDTPSQGQGQGQSRSQGAYSQGPPPPDMGIADDDIPF